jgi:alanyl-tRNA synthetase
MVKKIEEIMERAHRLEKEAEKLKAGSLAGEADEMIAGAENASGIAIISRLFKGIHVEDMRTLSDAIRAKKPGSVVLLGSDNEGKALLLFAATQDAVKKGIDCGALVRDAAKMLGGGGGGRKDMAQAGGSDAGKLAEALGGAAARAKEMIGK